MLIGDIPALAAHSVPDLMAIGFRDRTLSYRALRDQSWRLSNALLGIAAQGDRIAILAENCPEYVLCYYGVPGAGMALTLLNYRLAGPELIYIIGNAEPTVLIVEAKYLPAIEAIRADIPSVRHIFVIGESEGYESFDALVARGDAERPCVAIGEDDPAWLLYTSGTTGLPKGAMLSHRNLIAGVMNAVASWDRVLPSGQPSVFMLTFPMFHIAGWNVVVQHVRRAELVIQQNFDPESWFRTIEQFGVNETAAAPTMIAMLLDHPARARFDLSSLKQIAYGAAAMPAALLLRVREIWPDVRFLTGFGMTELSGNVTMLSPAEHVRGADENSPILNSVGREMLLVRVRVVDETGRDVAEGEEGEIIVKGDQVLSGYWRNPEATAASFTDGWFHSGDIGRRDSEGYLYIVDRKKDMIVSGGENVYPREVEEVLYQHGAIVEAAVIGAADPVWGEEVVAVLTGRGSERPSAFEIVEFCRARIASYKKPRAVVYVDELPKNASGKILKRELRDRLVAGDLRLERP